MKVFFLWESMAMFSLDEGTSGSKRKRTRAEYKEGSRKKRRDPCGYCSSEVEEEEEYLEDGEEAPEEERDEEDDDYADEAGDKGCSTGSKSDGRVSVYVDADALECSICFEPFRPPIFQCINGHVTCSTCCPKLSNKCHVCSCVTGRRRCIALEKVVESVRINCRYADNGCRATISFLERYSHEEMCRHAPLFCPVSDCTFAGSKQLLSDHIKSNHSKIVGNFSYNKCFKLTMKQQESYLVLLGDDDHVFLLLNDFEIGPGNALSVIGIIPNSIKFKFSCVFRVCSTGNVLSLRTSVEKMRKWSGIYPTNSFLIVPDYLSSYNGIHVDVCIGKSAGISM